MDFLDDELQTEHLFLVRRTCRVCGLEKDLVADFYKCRKDATLESSYSYECKECAKKRTLDNYYKKSFKTLGTCSICKVEDIKLIEDRCGNCDKILRIVGNDIHILKTMIKYLEK
tara:strand:- start:1177 stop:1521 length:345 start_codon:yes stop_codon:yes gene_type:complete